MRGGKRQGAGRKKGFAAMTAEEARRYLAERVQAEIGPIADVLISKAKKGDMVAIRELFDRALGKVAPATSKSTFSDLMAERMREMREKYRAG